MAQRDITGQEQEWFQYIWNTIRGTGFHLANNRMAYAAGALTLGVFIGVLFLGMGFPLPLTFLVTSVLDKVPALGVIFGPAAFNVVAGMLTAVSTALSVGLVKALSYLAPSTEFEFDIPLGTRSQEVNKYGTQLEEETLDYTRVTVRLSSVDQNGTAVSNPNDTIVLLREAFKHPTKPNTAIREFEDAKREFSNKAHLLKQANDRLKLSNESNIEHRITIENLENKNKALVNQIEVMKGDHQEAIKRTEQEVRDKTVTTMPEFREIINSLQRNSLYSTSQGQEHTISAAENEEFATVYDLSS